MLKNEQINLRPIKENDKDNLLRWTNNPELQGLGHQFDPITETEIEDWIEELPKNENIEFFIISLSASNMDIGYIGIKKMDRRNQSGDLEMILGQQEYIGRGFEGQAMNLMLEYSFEHLNLNKVRLRIPDTNRAGTQFADQSGFTEEGKLREELFEDGAYHPVIVYGMLKSEWQRIKGSKGAQTPPPASPEGTPPGQA